MRLTTEEKRQLAATFGCDQNDLKRTIGSYVAAAQEEYLRMVLGQKVYTRGLDIREYRLFLMIKHVFGERLPSERLISGLFQTTTTQSRALLRAVMSKYQYELQEGIEATLKEVVEGARQVPGTTDWAITCDSENVIDALNRTLASIDGTLRQVTKSRGTVITYETPEASYRPLRTHFGLP